MPTTTIQISTKLRDRLKRLKTHPRQAYEEVIVGALESGSLSDLRRPIQVADRRPTDSDPVRHGRIDRATIERFRRMRPAESLGLAAGLTDATIALSKAGGGGRARLWKPRRSTTS